MNMYSTCLSECDSQERILQMLKLLTSLMGIIAGSGTSVLWKLASMLGLGILWKWMKGEEAKEQLQRDEQKLDSDINRAIGQAGKNAAEAKEQADVNEEYLAQKKEINEMKLLAKVKIVVPEEIKVGVPFDVQFLGLESGLPVMMDGKWNMGTINSQGWLRMILNTPGERTLSVSIGNHKFEQKITVV